MRGESIGLKEDRSGVNQPAVRLGRYELLEPLGVGGMAEVFKARSSGPGGFERSVVIKRILPAYCEDPEFVNMFVHEAKILGLLHHPNVVQAYDFGEAEGTLFLVLEYVDGPSVARVIRALRSSRRKMPTAIAAYIAREVCRALDYVHGLRGADGQPLDVVHRDVSPSNVILTATGGVKLLDFGVAQYAASEKLTRKGTLKGKPAYLAPEQLEGKQIDGRVDIFSLGIVLHEMLSLDHLFVGDSDLVTSRNVMEMEIPRPSTLRPDVSPELERIVMKALERDRERRYPSAAEMARELDDLVLSSRLHVDEVVSFMREVKLELASRARPKVASGGPLLEPPPGATADRTRKDFGLRLRHSPLGDALTSPGRRAKAILVGVALGVATGIAIAVAFG
jgi:serine/threonine protein kinase